MTTATKATQPTIITIAIIKGGSGKTTTAMAMAEDLAARGRKTIVLDSDNTGGATLWQEYVAAENERRQGENPDAPAYELGFDVEPINQPLMKRDRLLKRYAAYDFIIIDTPPSDAGVMQAALDCADVTIIPCQPSVSDLTHAGKTYMACNNGIVLLTRVKPRTRLARNAIEELDNGGITRFETFIREREAVKNMYGTNDRDKGEYPQMVQELLEYLRQMQEQE